MGFFNALRDAFLGKRMTIEARKSRLQQPSKAKEVTDRYANIGGYYGQIKKMTK